MNKSAHVRSILFAATESAVTISQKHGSYTVLCPLIEAVLLPSLLAPCLLAAAPAAFEVASIKPTTVRDGSFTINYPPGGRFSARNITVRILLQSAYDVQDYQIQGGPAWLATAGFDIEARPAEGAGDLSPKQVQP
ncbi:MAG TPA: TIGR03435 family protein [Acidobacteriaceae bacterium]